MVDKLVTMRNTFAFSHVLSSADKYRQKNERKMKPYREEIKEIFLKEFSLLWIHLRIFFFTIVLKLNKILSDNFVVDLIQTEYLMLSKKLVPD